MKKSVFILVLVCLIFTFFSTDLSAIEVIRVDQAKIRLIVAAGSSKTGTINITNPTQYPKHIKAYLEDWYYTSNADGSKDFEPAGTTEYSCADWISFAPAEITIPPFAKKRIEYTVKVPQGTSGGHYAILFLESSPTTDSQSEGVSIGVVVRVGCLFYIEPAGTIQMTSEMSNLKVERRSNNESLEIGLDFANTGNVDITAGGTFHIMDKQGFVLARGELNNVYTFPKDTGKLEGRWPKAIPQGKYGLVITIDLGKAREEAGFERGPLVVKEAEIEIGSLGQIVKVGDLK